MRDQKSDNKRRKKTGLDYFLIFWFSLLFVLAVGLGGLYLAGSLHRSAEKPGEEQAKEESIKLGKPVPEAIPKKEEEPAEEEPAPAEEAPEPEPGKSVTIAFAGDILFDSGYAVMSTVSKNGGDIRSAFSPELMEEMQSADLFLINNEFPYTTRGEPLPGKLFTFRAKPETANYLKEMGADLVNLANNHASDYGEVSLLDTLDVLDSVGIPHIGAGHDLEEASKPFYYNEGDLTIGIVSATQIEKLDIPDTKGATESSAGVFRCWKIEPLLEVIREARQHCDFLVVFIHWGTENQEEIDWAQKDQGPKIAEAGADLIVGAHPHILQKIDVVDGVPVFYSLGNFLFNSKTIDTGLLEAVISPEGELSELKFLPALQSGCRTELLSGEEKERILAHLRAISTGVSIDEEGVITW